MEEVPRWAKADPLISLLLAAGMTLDEAYGKAERQAIAGDDGSGPIPPPLVAYGPLDYLALLRAWDPALGPPPVKGYPFT